MDALLSLYNAAPLAWCGLGLVVALLTSKRVRRLFKRQPPSFKVGDYIVALKTHHWGYCYWYEGCTYEARDRHVESHRFFRLATKEEAKQYKDKNERDRLTNVAKELLTDLSRPFPKEWTFMRTGCDWYSVDNDVLAEQRRCRKQFPRIDVDSILVADVPIQVGDKVICVDENYAKAFGWGADLIEVKRCDVEGEHLSLMLSEKSGRTSFHYAKYFRKVTSEDNLSCFKPGDMVWYIRNDNKLYRWGKYTVENVIGAIGAPEVRGMLKIRGCTGRFSIGDFRLFEEFKMGDKVIYLGAEPIDRTLELGKLYTVQELKQPYLKVLLDAILSSHFSYFRKATAEEIANEPVQLCPVCSSYPCQFKQGDTAVCVDASPDKLTGEPLPLVNLHAYKVETVASSRPLDATEGNKWVSVAAVNKWLETTRFCHGSPAKVQEFKVGDVVIAICTNTCVKAGNRYVITQAEMPYYRVKREKDCVDCGWVLAADVQLFTKVTAADFNIGDKVICVNDSDITDVPRSLKSGNVHTVSRVDSAVYVDDHYFGFFPHRFQKITEAVWQRLKEQQETDDAKIVSAS